MSDIEPLTNDEAKALDCESPAAEANSLEFHHWDPGFETNVTIHGPTGRVIARTPQKFECEQMMIRLVDLRNAWPKIRARLKADMDAIAVRDARIAELEAKCKGSS